MSRALPVLFLITVGCEADGSHCAEEVTLLADLDTSMSGLTGAELKASLVPGSGASLRWADGAAGALEWDFAVAMDTLRDVESTPVRPPFDRSFDLLVCESYSAIEGLLALESDDGQLNAEVPVSMVWYASDSVVAEFSEELSPADLGSDFDLSGHIDVGAYDDVRLLLGGSVSEGALTGTLTALAERTEGDVISLEEIVIATFGAPAE